jgi:hypothetical protein
VIADPAAGLTARNMRNIGTRAQRAPAAPPASPAPARESPRASALLGARRVLSAEATESSSASPVAPSAGFVVAETTKPSDNDARLTRAPPAPRGTRALDAARRRLAPRSRERGAPMPNAERAGLLLQAVRRPWT